MEWGALTHKYLEMGSILATEKVISKTTARVQKCILRHAKVHPCSLLRCLVAEAPQLLKLVASW